MRACILLDLYVYVRFYAWMYIYVCVRKYIQTNVILNGNFIFGFTL